MRIKILKENVDHVEVINPAKYSTGTQDLKVERLNIIFNYSEADFLKVLEEFAKGPLKYMAKLNLNLDLDSSMDIKEMRQAVIERRRDILSKINGDTITVQKLTRLINQYK